MLTANDVNGEYVNGTMGTIIDISKERGDAICIQVLTDKGKKVDVYRYEREIERQDIEEREEDGSPNMREQKEWMTNMSCVKIELDGATDLESNADIIVNNWSGIVE